MNLSMLLEMVGDAASDRLVLGSRSGGFSAADLLGATSRAAAQLRATGAQYVVLLDTNSEAVPVALFASAIAGLPFVPVNYRLTDDQLVRILTRVTPAVVITGKDMASRTDGVDGLTIVPRERFLAGATSTANATEPEFDWVDAESIAVLLFTSGTTGEPKAAVLRHRHLVSYVIGSVDFLVAGEDEAQLISVPPYHIAGISSILSSLYSGRRMVYLPGFDPEQWLATVEGEGVTQAMVVPTMLGRILDHIDAGERDLTSLRHLSYGGGRMPVETIERAMKVLPNVNFVNAYGLTETSSTIAVLTPGDHRDAMASDDPAIRRRLASVGRPLPSVEVSIRDELGQPVADGERGEVWVRGEQVAGEYLGKSALTEDGWFRTRDAGWTDAERFLFLDGRLDDIIVRGGENLSPGEIESTLVSHPAVAEAAVVGIPDAEWGEAVAAAVVLEPGATASTAELQAWVRERLRSTKTPQVIQFRAEMPYNETGKLLRRVIRDDLAEA